MTSRDNLLLVCHLNQLFRLMLNVCACTGEATSLTLHKYVEEFPGLIHFIYVDRTTGRYLAPDMADCVDMLSQDTVSNEIKISVTKLTL